ncbi:helix-turn-helix transcriptional regulator [Methyloterricola oryzae]|uniref:helix-turn-helix transcriptional regulator n=1 Tax=Methyloterricola oryzae TaxID=1495050 RepID=UPI0005EBDF83|nr:helix-turn-helix transcriptional regulator [Methyloterricola oryzae]
MSASAHDLPEPDSGDNEATWPSAEGGDRRKRRFRRSIDQVMQQAEAFVASLEAVGDGVILLDSQSKVVFASNSVSTILREQGHYLSIEEDYLRFSEPSVAKKFAELLASIEREKPLLSHGGAFVVERRAPLPPLLLTVLPLSRQTPEDTLIARTMLILRDLSRIPVPQWQVFAQHFKLSGAETRLCLALADGLSLSDYSKKFHLSLHTSRTHIKSVFLKTETRRQADLLRLIFAFTRL